MPLSLRIPSETEALVIEEANGKGITKSAFILEAIEEKLNLKKNRAQMLREFAGWLAHDDAEELRTKLEVFSSVDERDWA